MTNQQLQLALAKMLPEKIWQRNEVTKESVKHFPDRFFWKDTQLIVKDTEWLHICWLVEQTLTDTEWEAQIQELEAVVHNQGFKLSKHFERMLSASWQQRAQALCKVKGITI